MPHHHFSNKSERWNKKTWQVIRSWAISEFWTLSNSIPQFHNSNPLIDILLHPSTAINAFQPYGWPILKTEGPQRKNHPTILCCRPSSAPPTGLQHTSLEANAAAASERGARIQGDSDESRSDAPCCSCDEDPAGAGVAAAPRRWRCLCRLVRHRRAPLAPHMPTSSESFCSCFADDCRTGVAWCYAIARLRRLLPVRSVWKFGVFEV